MSTDVTLPAMISSTAGLGLYFLLGLVIFGIRSFLKGQFIDDEITRRGSSVVVAAWLRHYFAWVMSPWLQLLIAARVPPNAVSGLSVLLTLAAGVAVAIDDFALGGTLYLVSGICDFLDGRVARHWKVSSPSGSALDSILDRYSEAAVLLGLAWFYRHDWVLLPLLAFFTGSFLVPYMRAKGESLGIAMAVGLMQRTERIVLVGVAIALTPWCDQLLAYLGFETAKHPLVIAVITVLAVSTQWTAAFRFWFILHTLDARSNESRRSGAGLLSKNALSLFAAAVEFGIVAACVTFTDLPAWLASGAACFVSSLAIFSLAPASRSFLWQCVLALAAGGLCAGGIALFRHATSLDALFVWPIVRVAVWWGWQLPLASPVLNRAATPLEETPVDREATPELVGNSRG